MSVTNLSGGIPPRCFTCGRAIAHLQREYVMLVDEKNKKTGPSDDNRDIIKKLGLDDRYCCYMRLMTHCIDLTNKL